MLSQGPTSPDRPGSGGGDLSLTSDLADKVFPDRSSRANPGPPHSAFRTHVAQEVGLFLRRALDGGHLRTSGRSALNLSSRFSLCLLTLKAGDSASPSSALPLVRPRLSASGGLIKASLSLWAFPPKWKWQWLSARQV